MSLTIPVKLFLTNYCTHIKSSCNRHGSWWMTANLFGVKPVSVRPTLRDTVLVLLQQQVKTSYLPPWLLPNLDSLSLGRRLREGYLESTSKHTTHVRETKLHICGVRWRSGLCLWQHVSINWSADKSVLCPDGTRYSPVRAKSEVKRGASWRTRRLIFCKWPLCG